jgi:hypothetical protein
VKKIYASLTQPPLDVIQEHEDEMKTIVKCPNCGQPTPYGRTRMCSGYIGCDNIIEEGKECYFGDLLPRILYLQKHDRVTYVNGPIYKIEGGNKYDER